VACAAESFRSGFLEGASDAGVSIVGTASLQTFQLAILHG
jgi:hypothetical protein